MVAKISLGKSLYGCLVYNGEKINKEQGRLLGTNKIFDACDGNVDINRAMRDFMRFMPQHTRTEKPVVHISLNPHPDDVLTNMELENIAREYLEHMGFGNQPFMIYKHEDIDRHHLHIVTTRIDENGKCISDRHNYHRSKEITRDIENKYGLHKADRKQHRTDNPLRKIDVSQGDVKKQVANTVKAVCATYKFRTMGEYRALLSLYNVTVEEAHGIVHGREYSGLVYFATDDDGNKVGNPFKASRIGKAVGYDAVQRHLAYSGKAIREKGMTDRTKRTVAFIMDKTHRKERFIEMLREKGIDVVFRHTDEGRIYGATFIDHRTGCVLNGSCLDRDFSANALQEHFALPYENEQPIPIAIQQDNYQSAIANCEQYEVGDLFDDNGNGLGLLSGSGMSYAVVNNFIKQQIEKGFAMYIYDFKFADISTIAYNHILSHGDGYKIKPKYYVINFDDPLRSHRCNPIHPDFMTDIADAYESAYTIILNLNKSWVQKRGDSFVESPIVLFAAIIWFLRIYKDGKYCTFPYAIEFLNRKYEDVFPILTCFPELENYLSPFMDAWQGGAMEQLAGQIASAKIPLSRLISPQLYCVMSDSEFTLDINNPDEPKIL